MKLAVEGTQNRSKHDKAAFESAYSSNEEIIELTEDRNRYIWLPATLSLNTSIFVAGNSSTLYSFVRLPSAADVNYCVVVQHTFRNNLIMTVEISLMLLRSILSSVRRGLRLNSCPLPLQVFFGIFRKPILLARASRQTDIVITGKLKIELRAREHWKCSVQATAEGRTGLFWLSSWV